MTKAAACYVAAILAGTLGCGGPSPSAPSPTGSAVVAAKQGLVITWGFTGVYFLYSGAGTNSFPGYDNLVMLGNFIRRLGEGRASPGSLRILYTTRRPQQVITDPQERSWYGPFLDAMAPLGTIEFNLPSRVALSSYTVVVYDPCEILAEDAEVEIMRQYLSGGGRALVLGDNQCWHSTTPCAQFSNRLLSSIGITFTGGRLLSRDPVAIPVEQQGGVFEGVRQVGVYGAAPQVVSANAVPLLRDGANILSAMATFDPQ